MTKKRRLVDLYVVGGELTIDDGKGDPIVVWLQKPNPIEYEKLVRRAGAAKTRTAIDAKDPESELYLTTCSEIEDLGTAKDLVEFIIADEVNNLRVAQEARLAAEDEWAKDSYLQGLSDSWEGKYREVFVNGSEDDEDYGDAKRVWEEIQRFTLQVDAEVEAEAEELRRSYDAVPEDEIRQRVVDNVLNTRTQLAWLSEFRRSRAWLCVREVEDHKKLYFESREEVDELSAEAFRAISDEFEELMVPLAEGKDLPQTQSSSQSPETPSEAEAVPLSGQAAVIQ